MPDPLTPGCTCPHGERSLGTLYGVRMGRGIVRLSTTKDCPVHDTCQHYTAEHRAARPDWSNPYCPIHGTRNCPDPPIGSTSPPGNEVGGARDPDPLPTGPRQHPGSTAHGTDPRLPPTPGRTYTR